MLIGTGIPLFGPRQRDITLKHIRTHHYLAHTFVGGEIERRVRRLPRRQSVLVLDTAELDELVGHLASAANHCTDSPVQRELDRLHARFTARVETEPTSGPDSARPAAPGPHSPRFTSKQGQYLAFIYYTKIHGRPPAEADLQHYFGVTPPSIHQMILTLEARGLLSRQPGQARSLRLLVERVDLPDLS